MLIMENSEEVMQILERYRKLKSKDIPKELEEYLCYVAKTGDTVYRWSNVKYLFREKLMHVIKDFHDTTSSVDDLPQYPNVDPFNYETMKSALLERLELFNAAPFTIQRLCELLTDPRKQYSRIDKYMRALEKNILVVSTIEPGRKQTDSENGDSLDSVVNGDISLDVNVDIDMENESIFNTETQNISSPSSSTSKTDDEQICASAAKKAKLDIEDNTPDVTPDIKSKIENEESSSDSDSQDGKETDKVERNIDETIICKKKSEDREKVKEDDENKSITESVEKCSDDDKENVQKEISDGANLAEGSKTSIETKDSSKDKSENEKSCLKDKSEAEANPEDTNKLTESKCDSIESSSSADEKTESTQIPVQKAELSETKIKEKETDVVSDEKHALEDNKLAEESCKKSNETSDNTKVAEEIPKLSSTENQSTEIIEKLPLSELPTVETIHKIPEQMSVEDSGSVIATASQECSSQPIPSTGLPAELATNQIVNEPQILPDQPMDEHLDSVVSSCPPETACLNEVVMQSETDMATDQDPIKLVDEKIDPAGMDVDDTSQEEAMDQ